MRIDAINYVAQTYNVNKSQKAYGSTPAAQGRDEVNISSFGKAFQIAKDAVKNSPDVREDKVADLKSKIDAGTYDVSAESFADKLIEKFNEAAI